MRTMSGSDRRIDRSADANVKPAFGFIWTWFTPPRRYSTGSSTVMMLRSISFRMLSVAYSVVDLPEPVGPVTRIIPYGFRKERSYRSMFCSLNPRSVRFNSACDLSRILITAFSPCTVGIVARNPLDRISDVGARRNDDPDVPSGQRSDVVDGEHVARIAHRNDQGLFLERDRQRRIALRQRMRHERRRRQVDLEIGQIHERKTDLRRERFDESRLADQAHIDQRASEALAGLLAFATGFVQLRLRDES